MNKKTKVLGRGLSAILGSSKNLNEKSFDNNFVRSISIAAIEKNPFQPRKEFDLNEIDELSISIKNIGIIQPIAVRKIDNNRFQLISGERRLEASKSIGLDTIPAYIKVANDEQMLEMALIENIQRKNLNPIEIAFSLKKLIKECNITQEQCSIRLGKKRSTITNYLRLLKLPEIIQSSLKKGEVTTGHVRPLVSIANSQTQINIFYDIIAKKLSVREVEEIVKVFSASNYISKTKSKNKITEETQFSFSTKKSIFELQTKFNTNIDIRKLKNGSGVIKFKFKNENDLKRLIKIIND